VALANADTIQKPTTIGFVRNTSLLAFMPRVEELTIEQCAELAGVIRNQLDEKKGEVPAYLNSLMAKVDEAIANEGTREIMVDGIVKYSFAEVPGRWKIVNADKLWLKLRRLKIKKSEVFNEVASNDKLAKLIEDGRVSADVIDEFTEQGNSYVRHTIKLLNE
jgi:hypothetical protein